MRRLINRLFHRCNYYYLMNEQPTATGGRLVTGRCKECGRIATINVPAEKNKLKEM